MAIHVPAVKPAVSKVKTSCTQDLFPGRGGSRFHYPEGNGHLEDRCGGIPAPRCPVEHRLKLVFADPPPPSVNHIGIEPRKARKGKDLTCLGVHKNNGPRNLPRFNENILNDLLHPQVNGQYHTVSFHRLFSLDRLQDLPQGVYHHLLFS